MSQLVEAGLTLTVVGMGVVFILLTLLVGVVHGMSGLSRLLGADADSEQTSMLTSPAGPSGPGDSAGGPSDQEIAGVVSAAVRLFRQRRLNERNRSNAS